MGRPILIMGRSGSGKSASLRNVTSKFALFNVTKKPLPFKKNENILTVNTDDYTQIKMGLSSAYEKGVKSAVIDDAGYLLTGKFMAGHRGKAGSAQFDLYNEIADNFYSLIRFIYDNLPDDMNVYVIMHTEKNDFGESKPKTIGKLLDDKVCVEGMFTIVLHALKVDNKYVFATQTDGLDVTKSPIDMFSEIYIDNDLQLVDNSIREYYK